MLTNSVMVVNMLFHRPVCCCLSYLAQDEDGGTISICQSALAQGSITSSTVMLCRGHTCLHSIMNSMSFLLQVYQVMRLAAITIAVSVHLIQQNPRSIFTI